MRQLELVALAHEHPEGTLAVAWRGRRVGEAAAQERERRGELAGVVLLADRGRDGVRIDARLAQTALDPLRSPAVEPPPVVGEPVGVASVVEIALLAELTDHGFDHRRLDALARQRARELGNRVVAAVERGPCDVARVLETHLGVG